MSPHPGTARANSISHSPRTSLSLFCGLGKLITKGIRGATAGAKARKLSTSNPFLKASSRPQVPASKPAAEDPASSNPFFAAMGKPALSAPIPTSTSYASVVGGGKRVNPQSYATKELDEQTDSSTTNPFLSGQFNPPNSRDGTSKISQSETSVSHVPTPPPYKSVVPTADNPFHQPIASRGPSEGTVLHLKGVHLQLNKESFLHEHFSKFGKVESVKCNIKKMCATVAFKTQVGV